MERYDAPVELVDEVATPMGNYPDCAPRRRAQRQPDPERRRHPRLLVRRRNAAGHRAGWWLVIEMGIIRRIAGPHPAVPARALQTA
ncbi:MAG: hypothetical protein V5B30_19870 [Candidatus Accumulibacter delftensis]